MPANTRLLYLDYETFYDKEYSLRKMTPAEYILDPRYETIMCSVAEGDEPAHVIDGPDFAAYIAGFDPAVTTTVTFNSLFDNCILAWKYGFIPSRMLDCMGMARALRGHLLPSASLASVNKLLGAPEKGTFINEMLGKRRADLISNVGTWRAACAYANSDVEGMRYDFKKLLPEFPVSERRVLDRVLRCAVNPRFVVDRDMLSLHLEDVRKDKAELIASCPADKIQLMSGAKFCALLSERGVDIEYKVSPSTGKEIPALARTDEFMGGLQEHEDDEVRALAAARLGVRSTIEESRCERLLAIAALPWAAAGVGGNLPVPLRYAGAHTHRLSGDWGINLQNLPSGRGGKKTKLRLSLCAPAGHKVIVIDLSQIEARICAWICGEVGLLSQFSEQKDKLDISKGDPYSRLAMAVFSLTAAKLMRRGGKDSLERFIGKAGVLGLGFGCGAAKFFNMVLRAARNMNMDMAKLKEVWTEGLAQKTVYTYRAVNRATVNTWGILDSHLAGAWSNMRAPVKFGPCVIGPGYVELPNNMKLNYKVLPRSPEGDFLYQYGKRVHKIYGSKFLENIVQALARIVIMNAALRLSDRGYLFALQEHDALAFIVPDDDIDNAKNIIYQEVTRRPSWAPTLPLAADIGHGQSYGEAK